MRLRPRFGSINECARIPRRSLAAIRYADNSHPMRTHPLILTLCIAVAIVGCDARRPQDVSDDSVYSLVRNSALDSLMRVHVATFDANEKPEYNHENCDRVRDLLQRQPLVTTRYWCEKGRFK